MFKLLIVYIALLNIVDGLVTKFGLDNQYIGEANPLMDQLYYLSPTVFVLLKASLSVILILCIWAFHVPSTHLLKGLAYTASVLYTIIFIAHSYWLVQL
ncbi:DUF5658 family protein [Aquibacillus salsiterrae]|uniref:DUF5658 family protein n=1 Tax=Aquibacillus salsiterrae TaxID=2950439 RepID=A0A9X4AHN8_9BACI|nr:DUF5658 family protein [Aquibacillus salsiterrae]MDC3418525.1 DUF5658 family protein [Aquibacillus salsiterrae]